MTDTPVTIEPPRGIGGWLILPLLGLILTPLLVLFTMVKDLLPVFSSDIWPVLTTPGSAAYHPLWAVAIIFEVAANIATICFAIVLLVMFRAKRRQVPKLMVVWYAALLGVQVVDAILIAQIPAARDAIDAGDYRDLFRALVFCAVWIPYFLISKRVKNTFVA
jgi:hypothetical protein